MNKFIRLVVSGLALCGALATVPGIAEAREPSRAVPAGYRNAPAHVQQGGPRGVYRPGPVVVGRRDRDDRGRDRDGRFEGRDGRWGVRHPVLAHERMCGEAREHGAGAWRLRAMGCFVR